MWMFRSMEMLETTPLKLFKYVIWPARSPYFCLRSGPVANASSGASWPEEIGVEFIANVDSTQRSNRSWRKLLICRQSRHSALTVNDLHMNFCVLKLLECKCTRAQSHSYEAIYSPASHKGLKVKNFRHLRPVRADLWSKLVIRTPSEFVHLVNSVTRILQAKLHPSASNQNSSHEFAFVLEERLFPISKFLKALCFTRIEAV